MLARLSARTAAVAGGVAVAAASALVVAAAAPASAAPAALAPGQIQYDTTGSTTLTNPNSHVTVNFKPSTMTVTLGQGTNISADLPLAPVTAGFKAYGFLPAKGTVVFTQVRPITGTLNLSSTPYHVTATAYYVVSLRNVTIGGANARVGTNCQSITPVKVAVSDAGDFNLVSGTLNGVYNLGQFQDCGAAQDIINDTLPGTANTLTLHIAFPGGNTSSSAHAPLTRFAHVAS